MSLAALSLWTIGLMAFQVVIVILKTRKHRVFLDQFKAAAYGQAISQLAKAQPRDAFIIRACYALCLVEIAGLAAAKKLFY